MTLMTPLTNSISGISSARRSLVRKLVLSAAVTFALSEPPTAPPQRHRIRSASATHEVRSTVTSQSLLGSGPNTDFTWNNGRPASDQPTDLEHRAEVATPTGPSQSTAPLSLDSRPCSR